MDRSVSFLPASALRVGRLAASRLLRLFGVSPIASLGLDGGVEACGEGGTRARVLALRRTVVGRRGFSVRSAGTRTRLERVAVEAGRRAGARCAGDALSRVQRVTATQRTLPQPGGRGAADLQRLASPQPPRVREKLRGREETPVTLHGL